MKISVIGVGAMGGAIVEGLVKSNKILPKDITVSAPHKTTTDKFATLGVNATNDNVKAVEGAELIVVAVKPWLAETVLGEIKNHIDYKRQAIISVMAGVSGEKLLNMLADNSGNKPNVYVVIPNIAIAQLCSMNFIVPIKGDENTTEKIKALFDATGLSILTEEKLLGAGTTLASRGIAYAMRYIRAASEGGVELGFKASLARDIVLQTVKGAVSLLQANGNHPEAEIDKVTTPGGLTIRGLNEMEHAGFTSAVIRGLKAGVK